jgi:hypothetical protein
LRRHSRHSIENALTYSVRGGNFFISPERAKAIRLGTRKLLTDGARCDTKLLDRIG